MFVIERELVDHVNANALSRLVGELPCEVQININSIYETPDMFFYLEDVGDLACKLC